jgi:hypothetical protein
MLQNFLAGGISAKQQCCGVLHTQYLVEMEQLTGSRVLL